MKTSAALISLVATATALSITSPAANAKWDLSESNTISWTHVTTDPDSFTLMLVNHGTEPETDKEIAKSVKTSDGKYTLDSFDSPPGGQYSIKAISTASKSSGQLAESQTFNITKSGDDATSTSSSPTTTPTSGSGSGSGSSASSSTTASQTNAAATLGQTLAVAGPLAALFAMLL